MSLDDPKTTLKTLLSGSWDSATVGFTPVFRDDGYDPGETGPQIVVSHISTPMRYMGLGATRRRYDGVYAVDVWSQGNDDGRWRMKEEVDRIVHASRKSPGTGLTFLQLASWRDLDELDRTPKIHRSQLLLELLYFKS